MVAHKTEEGQAKKFDWQINAINYRTEDEILKKLLLHSANFSSNLLAPLAQRILGNSTAKILLTIFFLISMLLVINSFIRKRVIKSRDVRF